MTLGSPKTTPIAAEEQYALCTWYVFNSIHFPLFHTLFFYRVLCIKQKVYAILANSILFVNCKFANMHSPKRKANSGQTLSTLHSDYTQTIFKQRPIRLKISIIPA